MEKTHLQLSILVIILCSLFIIIIGCDSNNDVSPEPMEPEGIVEPEPELEELADNDPEVDEIDLDTLLEAVVDVEVLRLRSGPSTDHEILDSLILSTVLRIIGQQNDWYEVITPDGKYGWVHGDYVINYESIETKDEVILARKPYSADEFGLESIGLSQGMSIEEVISILGEPLNIERFENGIWGPTINITYDGLELGFFHIPEETESILGFYNIYSPEIIGKRGILVGDTAESVIEKYYKDNESDSSLHKVEGLTSVELYYIDIGDGLAKSGLYYLNQDTGNIVSIHYWYGIPHSCGVTSVLYTIEDGLVKEIIKQ